MDTQDRGTSIESSGAAREPVLDAMAAGRILLGIAALGAPRASGRVLRVPHAPPEAIYFTRIYGARAMAIGAAFLTGDHTERRRWARLSLAVDISDTVVGATHLVRGDTPRAASIALVTLTASYAALGARGILRQQPPPSRRA